MSEKRWTGGRAVEFAGNEMNMRLIFCSFVEREAVVTAESEEWSRKRSE